MPTVGSDILVKGREKRCPAHSKPSRCQLRTSIDITSVDMQSSVVPCVIDMQSSVVPCVIKSLSLRAVSPRCAEEFDRITG
jgi:hypothetical protein